MLYFLGVMCYLVEAERQTPIKHTAKKIKNTAMFTSAQL